MYKILKIISVSGEQLIGKIGDLNRQKPEVGYQLPGKSEI